MHAKISHMHVKDHVVHVRVWWIIETPKRPSTHSKCPESSQCCSWTLNDRRWVKLRARGFPWLAQHLMQRCGGDMTFRKCPFLKTFQDLLFFIFLFFTICFSFHPLLNMCRKLGSPYYHSLQSKGLQQQQEQCYPFPPVRVCACMRVCVRVLVLVFTYDGIWCTRFFVLDSQSWEHCDWQWQKYTLYLCEISVLGNAMLEHLPEMLSLWIKCAHTQMNVL